MSPVAADRWVSSGHPGIGFSWWQLGQQQHFQLYGSRAPIAIFSLVALSCSVALPDCIYLQKLFSQLHLPAMSSVLFAFISSVIFYLLTHWGRVTHICVSKLTIIGSDNGLPPDRRQAIIWTNAGILLIGPLGTNFSEILIEIHTFSFKKMHFKMSSAKWRPFVSASMC